MLRVAVAGALGRLGRVACSALQERSDVSYAGGFARTALPSERIVTSLEELFDVEHPDVLLDVTVHPATVEVAAAAVAHGVRPVIGATGWTADELGALDAALRERALGGMYVPNFSIGAVLMMRFAREAARHFRSVEIVEMHHDRKKDAPSGTSRLTAERIAQGGGPAHVPIHSVRMRGMGAHQDVLFGNEGETLAIRHDVGSREAYVPGIVAAVHFAMKVQGLVIGLDDAVA